MSGDERGPQLSSKKSRRAASLVLARCGGAADGEDAVLEEPKPNALPPTNDRWLAEPP
jgi:hypothetical protein